MVEVVVVKPCSGRHDTGLPRGLLIFCGHIHGSLGPPFFSLAKFSIMQPGLGLCAFLPGLNPVQSACLESLKVTGSHSLLNRGMNYGSKNLQITQDLTTVNPALPSIAYVMIEAKGNSSRACY